MIFTLKIKQVAERLNLSQSKTRELVDTGRIAHYRLDGAIRVSEVQIKEYLDRVERREREAATPRKSKAAPHSLKYLKLT